MLLGETINLHKPSPIFLITIYKIRILFIYTMKVNK